MNTPNQKKRTFSQLMLDNEKEKINFIDLSEDSPIQKPKRQKMNDGDLFSFTPKQCIKKSTSLSPSIEILSLSSSPRKLINNDENEEKNEVCSNPSDLVSDQISPTIENNFEYTENKQNIINQQNVYHKNNEMNIDKNNDFELNDNDCLITEDDVQREGQMAWYHFKISQKNNLSNFKWLKHDQLKHLKIYDLYLRENKLDPENVEEPQYYPQRILDHQYDEETDDLSFLIKWKYYGQEANSWEPPSVLCDNYQYIEYCKANGIKPLRSGDNIVIDDDDEEEDDQDFDEYGTDIDIDIDIDSNHNNNDNNYDEEKEKVVDIDIESEYNAVQKQEKIYEMHQFMVILKAIDYEIDILCQKFETNAENGEEIEYKLNELLDKRQYFEELKGELLLKQFLSKESQQTDDNKNHNREFIEIDDDSDNDGNDDIKVIEIESTKTPKRTLFDYYFSPRNSNKSIKGKTVKKIKKERKRSRKKLFDKDINDITFCESIINSKDNICLKYLHLTSNVCYGCRRKWKLYSIELFHIFPICSSCPRHIRLGYNRNCKEDWFCPC